MQPLRYRLASALLLATFATFATAQTLLTHRNWEEASAVARSQNVPIVIVVTGNGCGHCERMKREFLSDPTIQSFLGQRALVRVYHESTGGKIIDFDGERLRARIFLSRYGVFATPTLLFLDPAGRPLTDPLVGYNDPFNYRDLLTRRLDDAKLALEAGKGRVAPTFVSTGR